MEMREIMDGINGAFNPAVTYEGVYIMLFRTIMESSKVENGKNLVHEYLIKKYYNKIVECFSGLELKKDFLNLVLISKPIYGKGRGLFLDSSYYYSQVLQDLFDISVPSSIITKEEIFLDYCKNILRDYRKRALDIESGLLNIKDDKELYSLYLEKERAYKNGNFTVKTEGTILNPKIFPYSINIFLNFLKKYIKIMLTSFKYLDDLCKKNPINLEEISQYLDCDKLYLLLAKQFLNYSIDSINMEESIHFTAIFLEKYEKSIKAIRENRLYNVRVKLDSIFNEHVKKSYTVDEFLKDYSLLKKDKSFPELDYYSRIIPTDGVDYRVLSNVLEKINELKQKDEVEALIANWEFLPKGTIKNINNSNNRESNNKVSETKKTQKNIEYLSCILENTNYEFEILGKDKFEGYKGFLYANGFIIFERGKLVNGILIRKPENATYVMQLDNFREMTKLTKQDIIAYIKNGNSGVRRIFHNDLWKQKILEVVNAEPYFDVLIYTEGILGEIRRLIECGDLVNENANSDEYKLKLDIGRKG